MWGWSYSWKVWTQAARRFLPQRNAIVQRVILNGTSTDCICDLILRSNWNVPQSGPEQRWHSCLDIQQSQPPTRFIGCCCKAQQLWLFEEANNLILRGRSAMWYSRNKSFNASLQSNKKAGFFTLVKMFLVLALRNAEMGISWSWWEFSHTFGHCPSSVSGVLWPFLKDGFSKHWFRLTAKQCHRLSKKQVTSSPFHKIVRTARYWNLWCRNWETDGLDNQSLSRRS